MLTDLVIKNFVLIGDATLEFAPGLTVLTGETGAGKTLLTQALGLLLGERASEDMVGPHGDEAVVQAAFSLSAEQLARSPESLREFLREGETDLVATRRIGSGGKGRCYLNGIMVPREQLADLLDGLVGFTAQQEHRRLLDPAYQRLVLDAYGGNRLEAVRQAFQETWTAWRHSKRELARAQEEMVRARREHETLSFHVRELEAAGLSVEEEAELVREQALLARAEEILAGCVGAAELLHSEAAGQDVAALLKKARALVSPLRGVASELDQQISALTECLYTVEEVGRQLRRFADGINVDPRRSDEVERRLRLYMDMARKYGGSTEEVVAYLSKARERLSALEEGAETVERLRNETQALEVRLRDLAQELTSARREVIPKLEQAVTRELEDLGMESAHFAISMESTENIDEFSHEGADQVEFLLSANPGMPLRPFRAVASGGELSRTLLAVKCALAGLEGRETLVFDEIDAGIGGRTAVSVGEKLSELARHTQVIVITHLPQVAAYADRHYLIEKATKAGTTQTKLTRLDDEAVVRELCRMLGGSTDDPEVLAHARALRLRSMGY